MTTTTGAYEACQHTEHALRDVRVGRWFPKDEYGGSGRWEPCECTRDDSCPVPGHWPDPATGGPHRPGRSCDSPQAVDRG